MATASAGYVLLDEFVPRILQYCNGCPSIMVRSEIMSTAIEMCERALVLKKSPSNISLEEDVGTYTLKYAGDRYRSIAVDFAKFESSSTPLLRTTQHEMDNEFSDWRSTTASKPSRYFLEDETNKITFWPMPSADIDDDDVQLICRVTYMRDQTEVDEFLYERWSEVIEAGVLSRLLMVQGATWYNPDLARTFDLDYRRGKNNARKTTLTGTGQYPGRIIPQDFTVMGSSGVNRSLTWE